eukprot:2804232-Pleurochrysis_carterae.AAC.2
MTLPPAAMAGQLLRARVGGSFNGAALVVMAVTVATAATATAANRCYVATATLAAQWCVRGGVSSGISQ